ncbi:MAG TPA: Uma2 family endonuclease [Chloroflexota bacterium]|nr:Uma2 family endonuclease [Chloroflexota bacterium]
MAMQSIRAIPERGWEWLPDDTEESVVGVRIHQDNINSLAATLRDLFEELGQPWGVGTNITLLGLTRPDGTAYEPMPDVLIHPRPVTYEMSAIDVQQAGLPWLVIEVASRSTVRRDVGEKAATYARHGIPEYLVFDPFGDLLGTQRGIAAGTQLWARRLPRDGQGQPVAGAYGPWEPEADGRWHCLTPPGLSFAPRGLWLEVWDAQGQPVPRISEERRLRREAERRQADAERRVAELEALLQRLQGDVN